MGHTFSESKASFLFDRLRYLLKSSSSRDSIMLLTSQTSFDTYHLPLAYHSHVLPGSDSKIAVLDLPPVLDTTFS